MGKMWNIHTMKHYLRIKRNNLLIRINLKNIMLSEKTEEPIYLLYDFIYMKYPEKVNL